MCEYVHVHEELDLPGAGQRQLWATQYGSWEPNPDRKKHALLTNAPSLQAILVNESYELTQSITLLKKMHFPLSSSYQLQTVSWLEVGHCAHFPISVPAFCLLWTCEGFVHDVIVSVSSYMCQSCCDWRTLFPWSPPPPLTLRILPPPPLRDSWAILFSVC